MPTFGAPSQATMAANARRGAEAGRRAYRIEWFIKNVTDKIEMTMRQRIAIATEMIHNKVVQNISKPVTVGVNSRGRRVVTQRSKPGEYPRADTGHLMRTIFSGVRKGNDGEWEGVVGTTLDYGAILELSQRLNRTYLKRTLHENRQTVTKILTGPIRK